MTRLDRHVSTVRGRLALAIFVEAVAWALLALAAAVFLALLAQRLLAFALPRPELWLAGGAGVAVLAAGAYALVRRPDPHGAAVAIDRELGLKEKFSTALHVRRTADQSDPFAAAAVRDAERTADSVDLSRRFAPEFPRAGYGLAAAALAVFLGYLLIPSVNLFGREQQVADARADRDRQAERDEAKANVEQVLAAAEMAPRSVAEQEQIQLAKATMQDLLARPIADPQQANRTAAAAAKDLEEALKQQAATGEKFAQAKQDAKLYRQMQPADDAQGPAADAQRNVAQGNLAEAAKDIGDLAQDFEKMSDAEKQAAQDQMKAMAQQLKDLADDPAAQQQVQQQLQQAGMTQEQAQQAQQLMRDAAQGDKQAQQQLQQMAKQAMQQMNNGQGPSPQQQQQIQQMMQQMQAQANTQQQAQQMAQAAQQMAQAMQQAQQQGAQQQQAQQGQQAKQGQQQQQGQQGQQGQQAQQGGQQPGQQQANNQQGGQPGQGQQGQGQQGQGQQGQQPGQGQGGQGGGQQMAQGAQAMQDALAQMQAIQQDAAQVQAAQQQAAQAAACAGGACNNPGHGHGKNAMAKNAGVWKPGNPNGRPGGGMGGPGQGMGGQAAVEAAPFGIKQEVSNSQDVESGRILASTFVKSQSIKGESKAELREVVESNFKEAADEVDQTRVSRPAQKAVREYFSNVTK